MVEDRKEDKEDSRHSRGLKGEDFFFHLLHRGAIKCI